MIEGIFELKISLNRKYFQAQLEFKLHGAVFAVQIYMNSWKALFFIPPCGHPHPISGESAPVTMGHEFSGVVYAVGEGVDDIQIGTTCRS